MAKASQFPDLEASLKKISELIEKMEKGELTLEESLDHFELGIGLVKHCQKILTEAEQKVQMLVQVQNQDTLVPYGDDNKSVGSDENAANEVSG